jgi:phosphomannomutase
MVDHQLDKAFKEGKLLKSSRENIRNWLESAVFLEYKKSIEDLIEKESWEELNDAFFEMIEFGTGGMRGRVGLGSARINRATIGLASQGLASYILSLDEEAEKKGVVIAYDTRIHSKELARICAEVMGGNGLKVYFFEDFRSTPELSFAVRLLGAQAGVVISASHNPPSDNGFKVYWEKGEQIIAPHDKEIVARVKKTKEIKKMDFKEMEGRGKIEKVGRRVDEAYWNAVQANSLNNFRKIKIVYTPLHGAGSTSVLPILRVLGFQDVVLVEEQMSADGNFPNVDGHKPNPEEDRAMSLALKKGKEVEAQLVLASDPDADRIAVAVKNKKGDFVKLTGNQVGVLLVEFVLSKLSEKRGVSERDYVVKTMVTSDLITKIAKKWKVTAISDLLVGFKYIAEVMNSFKTGESLALGAEESLGYLGGDYARDKDAALGAMWIAEMAAELNSEGKTVWDKLLEIYKEQGYFKEGLGNLYFEGSKGKAKMERMMEVFRKYFPQEIAGKEVLRVIDRKNGTVIDARTKETLGSIDGKNGNVLVFLMSADGFTKVTVRPSGTEPKVKFYVAASGEYEKIQEVDQLVQDISRDIEVKAKKAAES